MLKKGNVTCNTHILMYTWFYFKSCDQANKYTNHNHPTVWTSKHTYKSQSSNRMNKQTYIQITIIQPYEQANRYTNHNHPTVPKMAVDRIVGSLSRTYHTECRRVSQLVCVVITITSHYFYLLRVYGLWLFHTYNSI